MHPAPSVIIFTTFSGLGFGLLFWLGLGAIRPTGFGAFIWFAIAYAMAVGGLIASTFHLGHPERAVKAFSQYKTSWLSREGIAAVFTLVVMGLYALGAVFFGAHWSIFGILGALGSLTTVFTTSMIYAQLKTVPRWKHWTARIYPRGRTQTCGQAAADLSRPRFCLARVPAHPAVYARLCAAGGDQPHSGCFDITLVVLCRGRTCCWPLLR